MTDKTTYNIAKKIKEYRLKNDFSQAELAGKVGIAPNTLARLERGEHRASSLTIEKLAKALITYFDFRFESLLAPAISSLVI